MLLSFLFAASLPCTNPPGITTATLVCSNGSYPMTAREDGSFSVTFDCPLFEELHVERVGFEENGQQTAEALDIWEEPFSPRTRQSP